MFSPLPSPFFAFFSLHKCYVKPMLSIQLHPLHFSAHTQAHALCGCWLMTAICQGEVDKTLNIIFVLRAGAHRSLALVSFISGWTQRRGGTRRQPGSQQIYFHYFSIRTSASTDQALHLYPDISWRRDNTWRVQRTENEKEWQRREDGGSWESEQL